MNTLKQLAPRSLALILVIAALFFAGVSITGVAAQSAIPGDALYPVKTSIEQTRLTLAQDAGSRAQMKMGFAEQRLEEIAALIAEGRYREVGQAVLVFEADINSAILELETLAQVDPGRAARIAREITAALTRYAQTLSGIAASAPESVKPEVTRALDSTFVAGSLELPSASPISVDDNSNGNTNDDDANANVNDDDANTNDGNANTNDDANGNVNDDDANSNVNDDDANGNANSNDDNANSNVNDDDANANGDSGSGANTNDDSGSNTNDDGANTNGGGNTNDDSGGHSGGNDNGNDDGGGSGGGGNGNDDNGGGGNDNGND